MVIKSYFRNVKASTAINIDVTGFLQIGNIILKEFEYCTVEYNFWKVSTKWKSICVHNKKSFYLMEKKIVILII
jgi:hypothetical protein